MFASRFLCRMLSAIILILIVLSPYPAFAEVKEIIAEGNYIMGDGETPSVAQERAIVEAKRMAVEQAGTYLESFTEVKNMQLSKDEIRVFASGIVETSVLDKKRTVGDNDSIQFWVKVRCTVNSDSIQAMRNKLQETSTMEILKKVQTDYDKAMQEIAELKRKLAQATTSQERQQIEIKITQNEKSFTAVQWFEKGYNYYNNAEKKDYDSAIFAYSKAIELNPQYAEAHNNRGIAYDDKGQLDLAILDYSKAIQLNPQDEKAYNNRGVAYDAKGLYDLAISDYNKAIELNLQDAYAYKNRGSAYHAKGQLDQAISDYNKAIQLNPQYAYAFYNRGIALGQLGRNQEAISSFRLFIRYATPGDGWIKKGKQRIKELGGKI